MKGDPAIIVAKADAGVRAADEVETHQVAAHRPVPRYGGAGPVPVVSRARGTSKVVFETAKE